MFQASAPKKALGGLAEDVIEEDLGSSRIRHAEFW